MRNLKKVLTLVLTLAMLLSVMVVGAGAATFGDQDSITNKEAVDVCTTLNIINGYGDGTFRPNGNVTRAEMCKMICVALNGGKDPTFGSGSAATFNDVASDNWAKPFIEYCVSEGIVGGVGGGRFNPDGNITGTQTAKMLLCILGYDASIAGYVGNDAWEMKINVDASAKHLYDGITGIDASAPLTRDQAAQMIWNALQANEVEYVNTFVPGPGGSLISQATVRDKVVGNNDDYITLLKDKYNAYIDVGTLTKIDGNELTISLNDNDKIESDHNGSTLTFTKLTVNYSSLLGEKVKVVTKDGKFNEVMGVYSTDENTVYSTVVNAIDKDGDKIEIDGKSYAIEKNIKVYVDGVEKASVTLDKFANGNVTIAAGLVRNDQSPDFIKFVDSDDNDKIDTALISTVTLAKVTYVSSSEIIAGTQTYKTEDHNIASDIAKDDYVAITANLFDDCKDIVKAQKLTAVSLSGTKASPNQYQIDGTWYVETANNPDMNSVEAGTTVDAWVYNGIVAYAKRSSGENATLNDVCVVIAQGTNLEGDQVKILRMGESSAEIVKIDTDPGSDYVAKNRLVNGGAYEYSVRNNEYRFKTLSTNDDYFGDYTSLNTGGATSTGPIANATDELTMTKSGSTVSVTKLTSGTVAIDDSAKIVLIDDYNAASLTSPINFKVVTGKQLNTLAVGAGANDIVASGGLAAFTSDVDGVTRVTYAVVAVNGIASSFQVNDNYGYVTATSYKAANGYIVYSIWNGGPEPVTVQEKSTDTRTKGDIIGYSSIDTASEGNIPVINDVSDETDFILVDNGVVRGVNAAGTKVSFDGTVQKNITSDTKVLYVDTVDHVGYTSGTVQAADKVGNVYIPNVMYIMDGTDDIALLVVDQKNKLHGAKEMSMGGTVTGADIVSALTVADNVTLPNGATVTGVVTIPAGKTMTLNGIATLNNDVTVNGNMVIKGNVSGSGSINVGDNGTVTLTTGVTTIPKIAGTGNVVIADNIAGNITFNDLAKPAASAAAGATVQVTEKGPQLSGNGKVTNFSSTLTIQELANRTNSKTVTAYALTLTGANAALESNAGTLTGKLTLKDGSVVDCVFAGGTSLAITNTTLDNNNLEMSVTIGDNVQKVAYTITPATAANAKTWTFTF